MISIIISSHHPDYFAALEINIAATIGAEYEIIQIHNPGIMGICEAYNKGAQQAKYDILCFTHEDVEFKTNNWGNKVAHIFNTNADLGLLGVAGNIYKSLTPSHWSFPTANRNSFFVNVIMGNDSSDYNKSAVFYSNPKKNMLQQVAAIDGFWFCTPKKVVLEFPFDQVTCPGFHGYDVDFSLAVQEKYKVAITFEVLLYHFSSGNFQREWIDETIKVHKKWKKKLPLLIETFDGFNQLQEEQNALTFFMKKMADYGYSLLDILKIYQFQNKQFSFPVRTFFSAFREITRYKDLNKRKAQENAASVIN